MTPVMAELMKIAVEGTISHMSSIAKVDEATMERAILADPNGAAAKRFLEYVSAAAHGGLQFAAGKEVAPRWPESARAAA